MTTVNYRYDHGKETLYITTDTGSVSITALRPYSFGWVECSHNLRLDETEEVAAAILKELTDRRVMLDNAFAAIREHYTPESKTCKAEKKQTCCAKTLIGKIEEELPKLLNTVAYCEQQERERFEAELAKTQRQAEEATREEQSRITREIHEAALAAKDADRLEWIAAHGSDRLKRCLAEGIKCNGIYRTERIAADAPGWEYHSRLDGDDYDPVNPPAYAFELLDKAREQYAEAVLRFWKRDEEDEYGEICSTDVGYVAIVECPWDGNDKIVYGLE